MKKRIAIVLMLAISMVASGIVGSYAAKSINPGTNTPSVIDTGGDQSGIRVVPVSPNNYDNNDVKNLVKKFNNGEVVAPDKMNTVVPQDEDKQDSENFPADNGFDVNLKLYDIVVGPYDIVHTISGVNQYEIPEAGKVKVTCPELKGHIGTDLLVMVIDSKTGEMHLIAPEYFNPTTGMLTFDLPCGGVFFVLQKLPIVVRDIDPDKYPSEDVAKAVKKLPSNKFMKLSDMLTAFGNDDSKLEVADGVKVKVDNYSAATYLADVAVKLSNNNFNYNLTTKLKARLFQDIDEVNYERILDYAKVDYDKDAVKKDKDLLADIEPFILEDSFVYHVDAATGEVSIIYEPEISFNDYDDDAEQAVEAAEKAANADSNKEPEAYGEAENTAFKVDSDKIKVWDVDDIDEDNDDSVCICINGEEYLGMGPFALFMPDKTPFPWWIILVIVAVLGVGYAIYKKNKNKKNA